MYLADGLRYALITAIANGCSIDPPVISDGGDYSGFVCGMNLTLIEKFTSSVIYTMGSLSVLTKQ